MMPGHRSHLPALTVLHQHRAISLRDDFLTDRAAGAIDGTAPEPGPGGDRIVVDNGNHMTIANGVVICDGGESVYGDPGILWDADVIRTLGTYLVAKAKTTSGAVMPIGWDANKLGIPDRGGFVFSGTTIRTYNAGFLTIPFTITYDQEYWLMVILRANGTFYFIKGGTEYTNWHLVWLDQLSTNSPLQIGFANHSSACELSKIKSQMGWFPKPLISDGFSDRPVIRDEGDANILATIRPTQGAGVGGGHWTFSRADGTGIIPNLSSIKEFFNPYTGMVYLKFQQFNHDNLSRQLYLQSDADNRIYVQITNTSSFNVVYESGNDVNVVVPTTLVSENDVVRVGLTWDYLDSGNVVGYFNAAAQLAATIDAPWNGGDLTQTGFGWDGIANNMDGRIYYIVLVKDIAPTPTQMNEMDTLLEAGTLTAAWLDNEFGAGNWAWWDANETFESDNLGHQEQIGGGQVQWINNSFIFTNGVAKCIPARSNTQELDNGDFTNWTADDPDDWVVVGESGSDPEASEVATGELHADAPTPGGGHLNFYTTGGALNIYQLSLTQGKWYRCEIEVDSYSIGAVRAYIGDQIWRSIDSAATFIFTGFAFDSTRLQFARTGSTDLTIDYIHVWELAVKDLICIAETNEDDVIIDVDVTAPNVGTQAGIIACVDDEDDPQNYLLALVSQGFNGGAGAYVQLYKVVAGVATSLISAAVTYGAGNVLRLLKSGTTAAVFYNGAQVGTTQTVGDAGIISNTKHGVFATDQSISLDDFTCWKQNPYYLDGLVGY